MNTKQVLTVMAVWMTLAVAALGCGKTPAAAPATASQGVFPTDLQFEQPAALK